MFQSATLKLTGWYLLILMSISLIFSISIYNIASHEVDNRLQDLQSRYESSIISELSARYTDYRDRQYDMANTNLFFSLVYVNGAILVAGGIGSYVLARRTLRDIEEAHESQSRFTSDASHELRTPLAVMKSEIEVTLRDTDSTKEELRETLQSNLEEVDKLSRLSKVLLQLSKIDHTDITMQKLNLKQIASDVIKRQNQPSRRIKLSAAANLPATLGNQESIEELLMILVDNALKYSPDDSLVTLKLSKKNNRVAAIITNEGNGISSADLPHIFDRFYRTDTARTNNDTGGHGLGLALAKKIVAIHHGELTATSSVGGKTTFTVLLPSFRSQQKSVSNAS